MAHRTAVHLTVYDSLRLGVLFIFTRRRNRAESLHEVLSLPFQDL